MYCEYDVSQLPHPNSEEIEWGLKNDKISSSIYRICPAVNGM